VDKDGAYAIQGGQATSCGKYMEARAEKSVDAFAHTAFIAGYVTAYNRLTPETYDILGGTDMQSVAAWLDNYCKAHPLKGLATALDVLTAELYPRRYKSAKEAGH